MYEEFQSLFLVPAICLFFRPVSRYSLSFCHSKAAADVSLLSPVHSRGGVGGVGSSVDKNLIEVIQELLK